MVREINAVIHRELTLSSSDINRPNFVLIISGFHYLIAKCFHFDFDFNSNHWNEVYLNHNDCWLLILRSAKGLLQSSYAFLQFLREKEIIDYWILTHTSTSFELGKNYIPTNKAIFKPAQMQLFLKKNR